MFAAISEVLSMYNELESKLHNMVVILNPADWYSSQFWVLTIFDGATSRVWIPPSQIKITTLAFNIFCNFHLAADHILTQKRAISLEIFEVCP